MRTGKQLITKVPLNGDTAAERVTRILRSAGYQVVQSFDSNPVSGNIDSRSGEQRNCTQRMMIFLVYAPEGSPATLWIDSDPTPQSMISLSNEPAEWHETLHQMLTQRFPPYTAKTSENNPLS